MQIKCVVTGKQFIYNNFPDSKNIAGLHPILTLSKVQLLKIAAQSLELNAEDNALLFLAFASKLTSVEICPPISLDSLGSQFTSANLPLLISACQAMPSRFASIPSLRLSQDCINDGGLIGWLELLQEGLKYGSILSVEADQDNEIDFAKAITASRKRNVNSFKLVWAWALDNMLIRCPEFKVNGFRTLDSILSNGKPTGLAYMQDLKGRLLDYLPENSADFAFRKRLVIERVDSCIAEALKISAIMGLQTDKQITTIAAKIASTYSIDGVANAAAAPTKALKELETFMQGRKVSEANESTKVYPLAKIESNPMLKRLYEQGKIAASNSSN